MSIIEAEKSSINGISGNHRENPKNPAAVLSAALEERSPWEKGFARMFKCEGGVTPEDLSKLTLFEMVNLVDLASKRGTNAVSPSLLEEIKRRLA